MEKKYDIFISYSRKDTDIVVDRYTSDLKRAGLNVWIDEDGIETGDEFKTKIVRAITNSEAFLFFSSAASNESPWTVKEVNVAVLLKKRVIPVKLDSTIYQESILFDLAGVDYIDHVSIGYEAAIKKLLSALGKQYVPITIKESATDVAPLKQEVVKTRRKPKVIKEVQDWELTKEARTIRGYLSSVLGLEDFELFQQSPEETQERLQKFIDANKEFSKTRFNIYNYIDNYFDLEAMFGYCDSLPSVFHIYDASLWSLHYEHSAYSGTTYKYTWHLGEDKRYMFHQSERDKKWNQLITDLKSIGVKKSRDGLNTLYFFDGYYPKNGIKIKVRNDEYFYTIEVSKKL